MKVMKTVVMSFIGLCQDYTKNFGELSHLTDKSTL